MGEQAVPERSVEAEIRLAQNKRQRAEDRLYRSDQWLRMLIDSAEDYAIFAVNPEGKIATWNTGAQKLFGYTEEEILGEDFAVIFTPEDRAQGVPQEEIERAQREGYSPDERWHLRKDGTRLFVSGAVRPLQDNRREVHGFLKVAHDVTGQKQVKQEAQRSHAELEAVIQAMQGGVVVADTQGKLILVNEAMARLTGYGSEEELRNKTLADFATVFEFRAPDGQLVPFEESPLSRVVRGEKITDWQLRARRLDTGQQWVFSFSGQPVRDESGQMVLAVLVTRDITRTKQVEAEIREARDQLAQSNEELEERVRERTALLTETIHELEGFSYSLSHDMRAPLRAMQSFAEILRTDFGKQLGPEGAELLERIVSAAARLDQLIQDVLTLSRLRSERVKPHPVDLEKLLRQIIGERAALQPPQADVEIGSPLLEVMGHEASLTQCLSNLLDNAVKFVAPGVHPEVRVWTEERTSKPEAPPRQGANEAKTAPPAAPGSDGRLVRVWVQDNGIGIPLEYKERIFEMFQRLHGNEQYQGTGIGLAIVRKAVERMGGRAGVESEPGKGSRFWLDLPSGDR